MFGEEVNTNKKVIMAETKGNTCLYKLIQSIKFKTKSYNKNILFKKNNIYQFKFIISKITKVI